jgi:hypothetical protein
MTKNPRFPTIRDLNENRICFAVLISLLHGFRVTVPAAYDLGFVTGQSKPAIRLRFS